MKYYNGSEWKSEDLASPTEDGLMPKEDKATLDGASTFGKDFLKSNNSDAARGKLGLSVGATANPGTPTQLAEGTNSTDKVWSPKAIADYVKAGDTTSLSEAKSYADTSIDNAKTVVSVKDFGAIGDGTTDNTTSVQDAINYIGTLGGGTLYFPQGEYFMSTYANLVSNMRIEGDGAILRKLPNATSYAFFVASSGENKGYGGSVSNIYCTSITFKGTFGSTTSMANSRTACAFAMHHASNVIVENCKFIECSGTGHRFDLQGCEKVTIRNCVFKGYDSRRPNSDYYNEDIQLDNSTKGGLSFTETSDLGFDGIPCRDITIENNSWEPYYSASLDMNFPSATAIGHHSSVEGMYGNNIRIINNSFIQTVLNPESNYSGTIHFASWENVLIEGNTFDGKNTNMQPINIQGTDRAIPLSNVTVTSNPGIDLTEHQMCSNVKIMNNTFKNCASTVSLTGSGLIKIIREGTVFNKDHKNFIISGNIFMENKYNKDPKPNDSLTLITARNINKFKVSSNIAEMNRRLVTIYNCTSATVDNNTIMHSSSAPIAFESCVNSQVTNNTVTGYCGSPVIQLVSDSKPLIVNNRISVSGGGIVAMRIKDTNKSLISRNIIESTTSTDYGSSGAMFNRGIELSGSSADAIITDNIIIRANTPVGIIDTAAAAVNDRNTVFTSG